MSWAYLAVAIALEVAGTTSMKYAEGFTRPLPSILVFVCYGLCFGALTLALRGISLSVAYAVWVGAGTALIAGVGVALFGEALTAAKVLGVGLIVAGVVILNAAGGAH